MSHIDDQRKSTATGGESFATTHWSIVLAAGQTASPQSEAALDQLCRTYWYPLYAYVRRRGYSPEDAQDLTQGFFERLLSKKYLGQVHREKGRFRAFLLASIKHFLSDQRDRERAAKRGGGQLLISLSAQAVEERYRLEPADAMSPDRLYDRRWAFTVLEHARARLREEVAADGKLDLYEGLNLLERCENKGLTYAELGQRFALSESGVKSAALRFRQRYSELAREQIARTVSRVAEIDDEIRYLLTVIAE